jgi:two-component system LytT family sensor kinase
LPVGRQIARIARLCHAVCVNSVSFDSMKPRLWLLAAAFIVFYLFTDLNWQIGNYLSGHKMYGFLQSRHGLIGELSSLLPFLLYSIISYLLFFVLFYKKKLKTLTVIAYLFIAIPLMIFCRYAIQEALFYQLFGYHNYSARMRVPARYFMDNIYFAIYHSAFGIVFFFIQLANFNQRQQQELMLQNRQAELSFLRSQINPHFLFNSLNNVYTLVYQQSANALPSISKLSELLRYMLYEKEELVPLQKEAQYLANYIDLQLMRYNFLPAKQINISAAANSSLMIAPLTLIPFVENAFKHGDLKDHSQPMIIDMVLDGQTLHFKVINKKSELNKDEAGGIGLDNVKKRLALIYPDNHKLHIEHQGQLFTVQLTINLHE